MKIVLHRLELSRRMLRSCRTAILLLAPVFLGMISSAHGCVALGPDGKVGEQPVIKEEQAVIIWDETNRIEHFIRQADIATAGPSVGFLVPTPATPDLVEVDPAVFGLMKKLFAPDIVPPVAYQTPFELLGGLFPEKRVFTTISTQLAYATNGIETEPAVQVIHEQEIADYHAAILEARDVDALKKWLKDNGYAWPQNADAWLKPYIDAKWKITAFKLTAPDSPGGSRWPQDGGAGHGSLLARGIRMSFPTDHPFFPYSEPGDTEVGQSASSYGRSLSVAFLGTKRMSGRLKDGDVWPGETQFAGDIQSTGAVDQIFSLIKLERPKGSPASPAVLTYFEDKSDPRPGTADLYFEPGADQTPIPQETVIDPSLPTEYRLDLHSPPAIAEGAFILLVLGAPFVLLGCRLCKKPGSDLKA